jgi:hypothetical protein
MARLPVTTAIRREIVIIASTLAWCGERPGAGGSPGWPQILTAGGRAAFAGTKGRFSPDPTVLRP